MHCYAFHAAMRLLLLCALFDLHQYGDFPTHIHGHSLDFMICSPGCNFFSVSASDLFLTTFLLLLSRKFHPIIVGPSHKLSSTERYNQSTWKPSRLISKNSDMIRYLKTNATELALQYDSVLHTLINLHAPLVTHKISIKPPNPLMTSATFASKRYRRYLQRVWRSNPTALNRSRLTRQTHSARF